MAGGVVVAAAAAARRRQLEHVLDTFRVASATTADGAQSFADLHLPPSAAIDELTRAGVLRAGRSRATWYLDEVAYIAFRDARPRRAIRVVLALVLALLALLLGVFSARIHTTR